METVNNMGKEPVTSSAKFARDEDGRTRVDHGDTAMISDPVKDEHFILDKPKKIAIPSAPAPPAMPAAPEMPGMPKPPAAPAAPAAPKPPEMPQIADLGEQMVNGVKAQGKRYAMPALPGMPAAPQIPGAPKPPAAPATHVTPNATTRITTSAMSLLGAGDTGESLASAARVGSKEAAPLLSPMAPGPNRACTRTPAAAIRACDGCRLDGRSRCRLRSTGGERSACRRSGGRSATRRG